MIATRNTVLCIVAALVTIGVVVILSATASTPPHVGDPFGFFRRQIAWSVVGGLALLLVWRTDHRTICRAGPWLLGIAVILLALVLVAGAAGARNGANRWLRYGPVGFQPSEFAKIAVVVFLAWFGARARDRMADLREGFLPAAGAICAVAGLVLVEPDVGTAVFIASTGLATLLVAGARPKHLIPVGAAAIPLAVVYAALRFDHVKARLAVFLDPGADPLGKGHQVRQSLIALGSGGPLGVGIGEGHQQLLFLPEGRNDFVLALIGEEMGLAGTIFVLGAFAALVLCGRRIMRQAADNEDREGFLLAFGVTLCLGLQAAMNVAVVTASIPNKGISLPFVSYGGSSLVFSFAAVGLLLSVARAHEAAGAVAPWDRLRPRAAIGEIAVLAGTAVTHIRGRLATWRTSASTRTTDVSSHHTIQSVPSAPTQDAPGDSGDRPEATTGHWPEDMAA